MRKIEEIIKELESHPDYVWSEIWTKDDIIIELSEIFYNRLEFDDGVWDDNGNLYSKDIDYRSVLNEEDWRYFKELSYHYYSNMKDYMARYGDYDEENIVPFDFKLDIYKRLKREVKLQNILGE